ncbi:MBL fold metallo-hydrolase [Lentilitoribacter sp. Alg239-R112]|uniref:MBL fold metallo-hydrolase n=1 Tax=Lentilitoribacter sp. Alg239-R112 TaxID=2305987 RepID=UPI0013A6BEF0|nr:MBL fold metallo-hydrolase [Lentilitoribacter sp. Alg239-R112]
MNISRRNFLGMGGAAALAAPFIVRPNLLSAHEVGLDAGAIPSYAKRRVGSAEITVLLDGTIDVGQDLIVGFDQDKANKTLKQQHLPAFESTRPLPVLGHVIDTGERKIAIDTGTLPGFSPKTGGYHAALKQAGIDVTEIDTVLLTHLHPDHIGGLSADKKRLFPNAEIVVNSTEWDFWHGSAADGLPSQVQPFVQIARDLTEPYKDRLRTFDNDAEVLPGIQAKFMPGHTPGHVGFHLHDAGEDLLFWGDLIHLPRLQFNNPEWLIAFDMDPAQTAKTRARMLDMAAADRVPVTGAHLEFPGFGYVDQTANGYDFVPAAYDYSL